MLAKAFIVLLSVQFIIARPQVIPRTFKSRRLLKSYVVFEKKYRKSDIKL